MDTAIIIAGIWGVIIAAIVWFGWKTQQYLSSLHDEAEGTNWPRGGM